MIEAVDLFCGSGSLTCGLRQSGVKVLAGVDFENECQCPYEKNNGAKQQSSRHTQKIMSSSMKTTRCHLRPWVG